MSLLQPPYLEDVSCASFTSRVTVVSVAVCSRGGLDKQSEEVAFCGWNLWMTAAIVQAQWTITHSCGFPLFDFFFCFFFYTFFLEQWNSKARQDIKGRSERDLRFLKCSFLFWSERKEMRKVMLILIIWKCSKHIKGFSHMTTCNLLSSNLLISLGMSYLLSEWILLWISIKISGNIVTK